MLSCLQSSGFGKQVGWDWKIERWVHMKPSAFPVVTAWNWEGAKHPWGRVLVTETLLCIWIPSEPAKPLDRVLIGMCCACCPCHSYPGVRREPLCALTDTFDLCCFSGLWKQIWETFDFGFFWSHVCYEAVWAGKQNTNFKVLFKYVVK